MKKIKLIGAEKTIEALEKLDNPHITIEHYDNGKFLITATGKLKPGEKFE